MIIPIGDDNSDRVRTPVLNYVFIAINVLVFAIFQGMGRNERFTYTFSTVPYEIVTGKDLTASLPIEDARGQVVAAIDHQPTPLTVYLTLLTSMFMHGSVMHLVGNMLYLWIFGDNLEDRMGRGRYLAFYLVVGLIASLAHVFTTVVFGGDPRIPSLGASGAIAGVLGGYLLLFPKKRVRVILLRFLTEVPASVAIGGWFLFQVIAGLGSLGNQGGGVAYAAHVGGFLAGLALVGFFAPKQPPRVHRTLVY